MRARKKYLTIKINKKLLSYEKTYIYKHVTRKEYTTAK